MTKLILENPRRPWLPAGLLILLSLLVFAPVIFGGQFFWDDYLLLVNNAPVHDPAGLRRIWFTTENPDYFPLTSTFFWIEWRLFGDASPQTPYALNPYHLVNALLHGVSAVLLWRVLRQLRIPGAMIAALLFVVHPVNAESVAWIAEGKNTLSVLFMLAALLVWVRSEKTGSRALYAGSLGLFLLALLAKTAVVMLPVAMVLVLWYRRRATPAALLRTIPFFLLSLALGLVTIWFQAHRSIQDAVVRDDGFASRLATAGGALWFYLAKACFPVWISFSYARWELPKIHPLDFLPLVLMAALLLTLWLLRRRIGRGFFVALVAYIAMLLPILGFVNVFFMRYSLVSDHWQYPALPFFCAAVGSVLTWFARRHSVAVWNATMGAFLALAALLAIDTASIAAVYRTPEGVWADVLAHDPDSWLAHERLGAAALERSRTDPSLIPFAMIHLRRVVDLRPDLVVGYTNLGNAYMAMGEIQEAKKLYQQGAAAPDGGVRERAIAHVNLGLIQGRSGDAAGAEREFLLATQINPESTYSWLHLGISRDLRDDLAGAREAYEKSIAADERFADPRIRLAQLALRTGDYQTARKQAEIAHELDPQNLLASRLIAAATAPPSTAASASAPAPTTSSSTQP
jgi:tetratricopeptide (TPR) repeat protein